MKEAAQLDKEEAAERDDQKARMPEVAKGLELPDEDSDNRIDPLFDASGHYAEMPSAVHDPAELAQQDGFLAAVQHCVDMLPKRIGQVFVLREVFGTDTKEICKDLSLTTSNVWVQLYRARMMLRTCLERSGFGHAQPR